MSRFNNFTVASYCPARWTANVSESELVEQIGFFEKYVGIDKVYLEAFRSETASKEQIAMCKRIFAEHGIKVSGGITTITQDLDAEDGKRKRLFDTFCYSNEKMRRFLKEKVEYTASMFDEFIIDDFFFTQCTCDDCQKEKGDSSWKNFRLRKMREVSENLIIKPAKAVNPKINIIIKYPNWRESFQETGYNIAIQKDMFDMIYTGTETRHPVFTDQHLPRYLSYSLMRFMENTAPGRNGGGWFDPYECYSIDNYIEQAYLTAFSKPKEIMLFCLPSLFNNKLVTPIGFRLKQLDKILDHVGNPGGIPVYLPHNSQGEDHLEDYLGMIGIPFEPTPIFPSSPHKAFAKTIFLTASALYDNEIITKIRGFLTNGGKIIASSGFVMGALDRRIGIEELTSVRYRGRNVSVDEFHISRSDHFRMFYAKSAEKIALPLLEHRNNATWSLINAGSGDCHSSMLMRDTLGTGEFITLTVPPLFSDVKKLPPEVLSRIREEFYSDIFLESTIQASLFIYDNDTFGLYSFVSGDFSSRPAWVKVHVKGQVAKLVSIPSDGQIASFDGNEQSLDTPPLYSNEKETVFELRTEPGDFAFYKIAR
jgi:hypothetical protein